MLNIGAKISGFGTKDTTFGFVEKLDEKKEADKTEIQDGLGDVVGLIFSNERTTVNVSFNLKGNQEFDSTIGGILELPLENDKTISIVLESAAVSYTRGAVTGYTAEGTAYPKLVTETGA
ncbi:hypothetical protein AAEX28_04185 [Lentisphaerota bacterium WC36G]|nr:hypothetical protein LJT99_07055 [Lentisphaerae bacterium WC36]